MDATGWGARVPARCFLAPTVCLTMTLRAWNAWADVHRTLGMGDTSPRPLAEAPAYPDLAASRPANSALHRLSPLEGGVRCYRWPFVVSTASVTVGIHASWRAAEPEADPQAAIVPGGQAGVTGEPVIDQRLVWRTALHAQWRGGPAMAAVFGRLRRLPVRPNGWTLGQARCLWESGAWACRAQYVCDDGLATNSCCRIGFAGGGLLP